MIDDGILPLSVDLYRPDLEVDADGGDVIAGKCVVREPEIGNNLSQDIGPF